MSTKLNPRRSDIADLTIADLTIGIDDGKTMQALQISRLELPARRSGKVIWTLQISRLQISRLLSEPGIADLTIANLSEPGIADLTIADLTIGIDDGTTIQALQISRLGPIPL